MSVTSRGPPPPVKRRTGNSNQFKCPCCYQPVSKLGQNFSRHIQTCVPGFFQMFPHFSYASTAQLYQQLLVLISNGTINIPAHVRRPDGLRTAKRPPPPQSEEFGPPKKKIKYANSPKTAPVRRINGDPKISKDMFFAKLREAKLNKPDRKLEKAQISLEKYKQITELLGACFDPSNYPEEPEQPQLLVKEELNNDLKQIEADLEALKAESANIEAKKEAKQKYLTLFADPIKNNAGAQAFCANTNLTWVKPLKKMDAPVAGFETYTKFVEITE